MSEQLELPCGVCRRQQVERRQANLRSLFYAFFMSRRTTHRRTESPIAYYSDDYGPPILGAALLLLLLCVCDSYFTLILIRYGSTELNPILAWALDRHVFLFFLLKYTVTAVCIVLTVMHKHFRVFGLKGYHVLFACLVGYGILIHYQLGMLLPLLL